MVVDRTWEAIRALDAFLALAPTVGATSKSISAIIVGGTLCAIDRAAEKIGRTILVDRATMRTESINVAFNIGVAAKTRGAGIFRVGVALLAIYIHRIERTIRAETSLGSRRGVISRQVTRQPLVIRRGLTAVKTQRTLRFCLAQNGAFLRHAQLALAVAIG